MAVLYGTGRSWLYCTVLVGAVRYWSVLYGTGRCCTSVYRSVLYVSVPVRAVRPCTVPCCTSLVYCTVLYVIGVLPCCTSLVYYRAVRQSVYSWLCLLGVLLAVPPWCTPAVHPSVYQRLCIPPCTNGCSPSCTKDCCPWCNCSPPTAARGVPTTEYNLFTD